MQIGIILGIFTGKFQTTHKQGNVHTNDINRIFFGCIHFKIINSCRFNLCCFGDGFIIFRNIPKIIIIVHRVFKLWQRGNFWVIQNVLIITNSIGIFPIRQYFIFNFINGIGFVHQRPTFIQNVVGYNDFTHWVLINFEFLGWLTRDGTNLGEFFVGKSAITRCRFIDGFQIAFRMGSFIQFWVSASTVHQIGIDFIKIINFFISNTTHTIAVIEFRLGNFLGFFNAVFRTITNETTNHLSIIITKSTSFRQEITD